MPDILIYILGGLSAAAALAVAEQALRGYIRRQVREQVKAELRRYETRNRL